MNDRALEPIEAGQRWAIPMEGPWGGFHSPVVVLDVKDGWVRYSIPPSFPDNRRTEGDFRELYVPYVEGA